MEPNLPPLPNAYPIGQPESLVALGAVPMSGLTHPATFSPGRNAWLPSAQGQRMPAGAPGWVPNTNEPPEPGTDEIVTTEATVMPEQSSPIELELSSVEGITVGATISFLGAEFEVTAIDGMTVTADRTSAPPPDADDPVPVGTMITIEEPNG